LTGMKDKGIPPFEQLKEAIRPLAIRDKKAVSFLAEFEKSLPGVTDIDALASKLSLTTTSSSLTFSAYSIPSIGLEPSIIGKTFSITKNKLSEPIKGKSGMYVIVVDSISLASEMPTDLKDYKQSIISSLSGRVDGNVNSALVKIAKVEDKRFRFF